jgi:hypothetical protein
MIGNNPPHSRIVMLTRIAVCLVASSLMSFNYPASAKDKETCEAQTSGVKRCELLYADRKNPDVKVLGLKSITYTDRAGRVIDWEINFPAKMDDRDLVILLIELQMTKLDPSSTSDSRSQLFRALAKNAMTARSEVFPLGKYDWVSSVTDKVFMMRASLRRH